MKAAVYERYGGPEVVDIRDVPKPHPKDGEVLIRVMASTVSSGDWRARSLTLPAGLGFVGRLVFGVFGPRQKVLGGDLSGIVEVVGTGVTTFSPGDEVIAYTGAKLGAHAEYRTISANGLIVPKPSGISFEHAAALCFGGTTALSFLRDKGGLRPGETVLIVGASGAVGSAAVQIAKHMGAEVTGVTSAANADMVTSLGADQVIDYRTEDFTKNGKTYDVILNASGDTPLAAVEPSLNPGGRLLLILASARQMAGLDRPQKDSGKRVVSGVAGVKATDLSLLADLAARGIVVPVIDRVYPFEKVREAHA